MILLCIVFSNVSLAAGNLEITDPAKVYQLMEIQNQIDAVSSAVMSCMDTGREHGECMCRNKHMFIAFSKAVSSFFKEYPDLKEQDLIHFRTPSGGIVNQSLGGIRRQADLDIECD